MLNLEMSGTNLEIQIMPQKITMRRAHRPQEVLAEVPNQASWEQSLSACGGILAKARRMRFVFSDLWIRYDMIRIGKTALSEKETISLAQARFARSHPNAASWPMRLAKNGEKLLIAGMDPALLTAMKQFAQASGARLVRVEPLFSRIFDLAAGKLLKFDGWLLFDEPGLLIAAYAEKGALLTLHGQLCDAGRNETARLLLERQAALWDRTSREVRIFTCMDEPLTLPEPWRSSPIDTIYSSRFA